MTRSRWIRRATAGLAAGVLFSTGCPFGVDFSQVNIGSINTLSTLIGQLPQTAYNIATDFGLLGLPR